MVAKLFFGLGVTPDCVGKNSYFPDLFNQRDRKKSCQRVVTDKKHLASDAPVFLVVCSCGIVEDISGYKTSPWRSREPDTMLGQHLRPAERKQSNGPVIRFNRKVSITSVLARKSDCGIGCDQVYCAKRPPTQIYLPVEIQLSSSRS